MHGVQEQVVCRPGGRRARPAVAAGLTLFLEPPRSIAVADGLLVGRFQPFHLGHMSALRFALGTADRLWIGIGSSNRPPEAANPFTAAERREMILSSVDAGTAARIAIYDIPDVENHVRWLDLIDEIVPPFGVVFTNDRLTERLYSERKSAVRAVRIPFLNRNELSGTRIRNMLGGGAPPSDWQRLVPSGTRDVLRRCDAATRLADL